MKQHILFINPEALCREEKFGGIVNVNFQMFLFGKKEYSLIKKIANYCYYKDLDSKDKKIADILLDKQILLKIDSKKGEKIVNKSKV